MSENTADQATHKLKVYLIGSLRNKTVPILAEELRSLGFDVFDDWYAAGEKADDAWRDYEKARGHTFSEGLKGYAADHVYRFDKRHLKECDIAVLLMPAGKSAHLELGWVIGKGKKGFIVLDNPDRWDVMYLFADGVFAGFEELKTELIRISNTI